MADDRQNPSPFGCWQRSTAIALWIGLAVIAAVLVWRRLAGAFTVELTALAACTFATLAAVAGIAAWILHRPSGSVATTQVGRVGSVVAALVPPFAIGAALFPPGSSGTVAYLTVLLLLTAAVLWVLSQSAPGKSRPTATETAQIAAAAAPPNEAALRHEQAGPLVPPTTNISAPHASNGSEPRRESVTQWIRREALPEGREQIEGAVRIAFAAGQKHAAVHLAFTPPLAGVPAIECEPLDTADVQLKVAAAYSYGARIEARRDGAADEPLEIEVGYTAQSLPATEST